MTVETIKFRWECKRLRIKMVGPGACAKRQKKHNFTRGGEVHDECINCPGPVEINSPPPAPPSQGGGMKKEDQNMNNVTKNAAPAELRQCKAEGCENTITKHGKTGFCRNCHAKINAVAGREKILSNKRAVRESRKKFCKVPSCENTLYKNNKTGFCRPHFKSMRARINTQQVSVEQQKNPGIIPVDLSDHPEILQALKTAAKEDLRSLEQQALFFLREKLESRLAARKEY